MLFLDLSAASRVNVVRWVKKKSKNFHEFIKTENRNLVYFSVFRKLGKDVNLPYDFLQYVVKYV